MLKSGKTMVVKSLEDLSIDKVFDLGCEFISNGLLEELSLYIKDITFAESLSQKLFEKILLHDFNLLRYFVPLLCSLSNIILQSTEFVDFKFLKQFNLSSFSCRVKKHVAIDDILICFNDKTHIKMRFLRLRKVGIGNEIGLLSRFLNIKFLDLSYTNLVTLSLKQICSTLSSVVGLNIGGTKVDDLSSLCLLAGQLEFLDVHNLSSKAHTNIFALIAMMNKLLHLDIGVSEFTKTFLGNDFVIQSCCCFSGLRLLDISGHQNNFNIRIIITILQRMPNLKYFIMNPDSSRFSSNDNKFKRFIKLHSQLRVIGNFSKQTLLNSLLYSLDNRRHLLISLHQLYDRTCLKPFDNVTLNATLLEHMGHLKLKRHECLLAITAVVYNITKGRLAENWTIEHLSALINHLITFLETGKYSDQLTINIFLIICNDYIIQKSVFEKLKLAKIVFDVMAISKLSNIIQSGVIIISILASELNKTELNVLVSDSRNFRILLTLVCRKCVFQSDLDSVHTNSYLINIKSSLRLTGEPIFDYILKFTLGSLWNLTDECTIACQQFVHQQGLFIYFIMIDKFKTSSPDVYTHICNKCLGLLNNIAEEDSCRLALLNQKYMDFLIEMLEQEDIQMTYFAGGILSNLLLIGDVEWKDKCKQEKDFYENRIYVAVDSWVSPNYLMANYRSFYPFENLIANAGSSRAILLWALWAIRHTMKIDRESYTAILRKHSQLIEYIELLALNHNPVYSHIRTIAADILILYNHKEEDNDALFQMMIE